MSWGQMPPFTSCHSATADDGQWDQKWQQHNKIEDKIGDF